MPAKYCPECGGRNVHPNVFDPFCSQECVEAAKWGPTETLKEASVRLGSRSVAQVEGLLRGLTRWRQNRQAKAQDVGALRLAISYLEEYDMALRVLNWYKEKFGKPPAGVVGYNQMVEDSSGDKVPAGQAKARGGPPRARKPPRS